MQVDRFSLTRGVVNGSNEDEDAAAAYESAVTFKADTKEEGRAWSGAVQGTAALLRKGARAHVVPQPLEPFSPLEPCPCHPKYFT